MGTSSQLIGADEGIGRSDVVAIGETGGKVTDEAV